jgi:hypothetical protein
MYGVIIKAEFKSDFTICTFVFIVSPRNQLSKS